MLTKYLLALVALLAMSVGVTLVTAAGFPNRVHYINHEKVATAMVKGGRIIEDEGLIVIANRGVQRGAEMHERPTTSLSSSMVKRISSRAER